MLGLQVRLNQPQGRSQQYPESDPRSGWLVRLVLYYCVEAYIDFVSVANNIMHTINFFLVSFPSICTCTV